MTSDRPSPSHNLDGTPKDPRRPGRPQKAGARYRSGALIRRHRVDEEYRALMSEFWKPPPKEPDGRMKRYTLGKRMALFCERYAATLEPIGSACAAGYAVSKAPDTARWLLTLPLVRERILELRPDAFQAEGAAAAMAVDQSQATLAAILQEGRRRTAIRAAMKAEGERQHQEAVAANRAAAEPEATDFDAEADREAAARLLAEAARFRAVRPEEPKPAKPKRYRTPSPIAPDGAVILVKPDRQKSRQPVPVTPWRGPFNPPAVASRKEIP